MFSYLTVVFAFSCLLAGIAGEVTFTVTLAIFSGVPNPQWSVTHNNPRYADLRGLLGNARTYSPENAPGKLGYEGFLVQEVRNGRKQPMELVVGPETRDLQLLLLQTMPTDMIPTSLKNTIREEIQNGNVEAQFESTKKRDAPDYDEQMWNSAGHIDKNNCYNYALNIRNDCFQHPGTWAGRDCTFSSHSTYCNEIMNCTIADGLVIVEELGINEMEPPVEPGRHLVALFCFAVPSHVTRHNHDFHFYRLDSNGYWSHKPGISRATDRDSRGNRIRDPRSVTDSPHEFVAFMTTDLTISDHPGLCIWAP